MTTRSLFIAGGAVGSLSAVAMVPSRAAALTVLSGQPFSETMVYNKGKIPKPYRLDPVTSRFVDALANAKTEYNACFSGANQNVTLTAAISHIHPSQVRYRPTAGKKPGIAKQYASVTASFAQFSPIESLKTPEQLLSWQNTWWLFDPNTRNDVPIMQLGTAQADSTFIDMPVPGGQLTASLAFLTGIDPNKALHTFNNIIGAINPIQGSASFASFFPIAASSVLVAANVEQLLNQLLLLGPGARFERDFSKEGFHVVLHQKAASAGESVLHVPSGISTYAFVAADDADAFDTAHAKLVTDNGTVTYTSSDGFRCYTSAKQELPSNPFDAFTIVGAQFSSTQ